MARQNYRRPKSRRGVLLLIVLSLLVLFMLVGLSFVVSATQFNSLSKSSAKANEQGMPGTKLADSVMYQLVRGTSNPYSSIRGHSLLEDMYGRDHLIGRSIDNRVYDFQGTSGNQIHQINITPSSAAFVESQTSQPAQIRDDYYGGCVLTYLNGNAAGMSTRIIDYKPSVGRILVKGIVLNDLRQVPFVRNDDSGQRQPLRFIINGRPFSGTGAGFNPVTGMLDNAVQGVSLAYMPSAAFRRVTFGESDSTPTSSYGIGGLDESWDAVDYQNMALAKASSPQTLNFALDATPGNVDQQRLMRLLQNTGGSIPSFHRPFLAAFLQGNSSNPKNPATIAARAASSRIDPLDHPSFTGSNSQFYGDVMNLSGEDGQSDQWPDGWTTGPWDVDNTGDGVADSIWIDAGLAPVSGPDGRLYKPLAAIHVLDMDGRISINATDSLEHRKAMELNGLTTRASLYPTNVSLTMTINDRAAWGAGFGPADISVRNAHGNLLRNRYAGKQRRLDNGNLAEQFVAGATPATTKPWAELSAPGVGVPQPGTNVPVTDADDDNNLQFTHQRRATPRIPVSYRFNPAGQVPPADEWHHTVGYTIPGQPQKYGTGYGSPSDLQVRSIPYLDPLGNTVWIGPNVGNYDDLDDPYEINLLADNPHDSPYTATDLDAINNRFDAEFYAESRVRMSLPSGDVTGNIHEFTTHSYSVPSLPVISPGRFRVFDGQINSVNRNGNGVTNSLRDMFAAKIQRLSTYNFEQAYQRATRIMAPEFARGEKLDINKILAPNEGVLAAAHYVSDPAGVTARQHSLTKRKELFARHLFNLMMLLAEDDVFLPAVDTTPTAGDVQRLGSRTLAKELQIRRIAQWAVNVVDFGDADSVMTQFRYDANPFNAYDPFDANGNVITTAPGSPEEDQLRLQDLRTVWGMEHPELALTETLAFHDRRAEDSDEDPSGKTTTSPDNPDPHFDSIEAPEGSAFFELYCTRSPQPTLGGGLQQVTSRGPEDLWSTPTGNFPQELNLAKIVGAAAGLPAKPVWRLAISEITEGSEQNSPLFALQNKSDSSTFEPLTQENLSQQVTLDPQKFQDPLQLADPMNNLRLRRFVWFVPPQTPLPPAGPEENDNNTYFNQLPNAAVRPGQYIVIGPDDDFATGTPVGLKRSDKTESDQKIAFRFQTGISHHRADGAPIRPDRIPALHIRTSTANGERLSVSEPLDGYDASDLPSDIPLDNIPGTDSDNAEQSPLFEDPEAPEGVLATGAKPNFRSVFLQRLANPNLPWDPRAYIDDLSQPGEQLIDNPGYNPYRTLDWMPIDLHVFNSLENPGNDPAEDDADPNNWNFASREKNGIRDLTQFPLNGGPPVEPGAFNIWSAWTNVCPRAPADGQYNTADPAGTTQYSRGANTNVAHSLGWLNRSFDTIGAMDGLGHFRPIGLGTDYAEAPIPVLDPTYASVAFQYRDIANATLRDERSQAAIAAFRTTFPSLVWHNRPYANPYEMLLVPATSNSRLGVEYTVSQSTSPFMAPDEEIEHRGGFGHLLNFFHSSFGTVGESNAASSNLAANYFRIFDFVHVPSRFKGTKTYLNQAALGAGNPYRKDPSNYIDMVTSEKPYVDPALSALGQLSWASSSISEFREPGKVNINTAPWRIWPDLGFDSALKSPNNRRFAEFELTMAGYDYPRIQLPGSLEDVSGRYPNGLHPAEYPNPLRNGTSADLMPPGAGSQWLAVDGTMLRSAAPRVTGTQQPALGSYALQASGTDDEQPLVFAKQNRKTNPYFRYKDLMKLGNSLTSQSNVYAIWVTIGYFEIEPNFPKLANGSDDTSQPYYVDPRHPDGYRYGVELGSDLGQVTRHRSFYIVDRSVPVAFEPGVNHNVDRAILVRRHFE